MNSYTVADVLGKLANEQRFLLLYRTRTPQFVVSTAETFYLESMAEVRGRLTQDAPFVLAGKYQGIPRFDFNDPEETDPFVLLVETNLNCKSELSWKDAWKYRNTIDFDEDELCFVTPSPKTKFLVYNMGEKGKKGFGIPVVFDTEKDARDFVDVAKIHFPKNHYKIEKQ